QLPRPTHRFPFRGESRRREGGHVPLRRYPERHELGRSMGCCCCARLAGLDGGVSHSAVAASLLVVARSTIELGDQLLPEYRTKAGVVELGTRDTWTESRGLAIWGADGDRLLDSRASTRSYSLCQRQCNARAG